MKSNKAVDYARLNNVVCPYCGYEEEDSWELDEDYYDDYQCGRCEKKFTVKIETERFYTSEKIDCGDIDIEHNYLIDHIYLSKQEHIGKGKAGANKDGFIDLPKDKWEICYFYSCSKCDDLEIEHETIENTPCFSCNKVECEQIWRCQEFREFEKNKITEIKKEEQERGEK
jgi:hypothetical protein